MIIVGSISTASTPLICIGANNDAVCKKSFTSVIEAQTFIESTMNISTISIQQTLPYDFIYSFLEQYCNEQPLQEAKKLTTLLKSSRATSRTPQKLANEMSNKFSILQQLIVHIQSNNEQLFCKQKYLSYQLREWTQILYKDSLRGVSTIPQLLSTPLLPQTPAPTLTPSLPLSHGVANEVPTTGISYLHLINNSTNLSETEFPFAQLAAHYLQNELGKLIALGFLTPSDIDTLDNKIELNYVKGCGTTRGSYHMTQRTDGSNRKFKQIKLNINLCTEPTYVKQFARYVRQIFIHELGHYLYYFKDTHTQLFDSICRDTPEKCESQDFVSTYAMKNKEEDYAESFASRYIKTTTDQAMIVDREHGSASTVSRIRVGKEKYFTLTFEKKA
ncbi:MAG: hypothetical protein LBP53_02325 [Candidatus Peribacteria bacterium]|jgi:hypothetical protein|nr:hypothetical protein [Candidatus Peribacteria bacterium]